MNRIASFVGVLALLLMVAGQVRGQSTDQGPFWFKFPDPKANDAANAAVSDLSVGLADLIAAFNGGRKTNNPVDADVAGRAIGELRRTNEGFEKLSFYVAGRRIDQGTIEKSGNGPVYYDLVAALKRAGYEAPVDGKSYVALLQRIVGRLTEDIEKLRDYSQKKSISIKDAQQLFFDAITQKILLEKLGATSGIISIAMQ